MICIGPSIDMSRLTAGQTLATKLRLESVQLSHVRCDKVLRCQTSAPTSLPTSYAHYTTTSVLLLTYAKVLNANNILIYLRY